MVAVCTYIYPPVIRQRQTLTIERFAQFYCNDYFVLGGMRTSLAVFRDPIFLWISWNTYTLNVLLV